MALLLVKEEKKQEDYEFAQLRPVSTVLSDTATDTLHFGGSEFCYFGCFHMMDWFVVLFLVYRSTAMRSVREVK
jgi:hypothetical protein